MCVKQFSLAKTLVTKLALKRSFDDRRLFVDDVGFVFFRMLASFVSVQTVFIWEIQFALVTLDPDFRNRFVVQLVGMSDVNVSHIGGTKFAIYSRNRRLRRSPSLLRPLREIEFRDRIEVPISFDFLQVVSVCVSVHRFRRCEDLGTVAALVDPLLLLRLLVVTVPSMLIET
jgi:hypothetical protein